MDEDREAHRLATPTDESNPEYVGKKKEGRRKKEKRKKSRLRKEPSPIKNSTGQVLERAQFREHVSSCPGST